jgi:hypothetical protein
MDNPEVRERIRIGMRAAAGELPEIQALDAAWSSARPTVRKRFLELIIVSPVCSASAPTAERKIGP